MEIAVEVPQKIKNRAAAIQHPAPGCLSEETQNTDSKDSRTLVSTAASFTMAKMWKRPRCPRTDDWIKARWRTYTRDYSAVEKNETAVCSNVDGPRGLC